MGASGVVAVAVTFAVGLALGGLGPRSQLRAAEQRLDEMTEKDCETSGVGSELVNMIASRSMGTETTAPPDSTATEGSVPQEDASADSDNAVDVEVQADAGPIRIEIDRDVTDQPDREFDGNEFEMMREAMDARRAVARQALRETAWVSDEQMTDIDAAYDAMNDDLYTLANELVGLTAEGVEPTRRDMMVLAADTLDVMIDAEQTVYDMLDSEQLEHVDPEAIDPFSYVDGSVVEVLRELDR